MPHTIMPLKGWFDFCRLPKDYDLRTIGMVLPRAEVNRFRARFRAAAAFRGIDLEGFSDETREGYSAFCRVLFVYSAFESFLAIIGMKPWNAGPILDKHGAVGVLESLWSQDSDHTFYGFLHEKANGQIKLELEHFAQANPCNVALVAGAIRHIFAHGHLTPNAAGGSPKRAAKICNTVADFLLKFMSQEFSELVKRAQQQAGA